MKVYKPVGYIHCAACDYQLEAIRSEDRASGIVIIMRHPVTTCADSGKLVQVGVNFREAKEVAQ